jgi:RHS repeat-associated protein
MENGNGCDNLDGIECKDGKPDQFLHSEGSVRMDKDGQFKYSFVLRDHLGNTRVTFSDLNNDDEINEKEEIIQINNYYAFGLNMEGNWNGANGANKYQYNGKEWNDDFGLGWNDYGARFYDPAMARWTAIDPLSEKYKGWSPYNYGKNNPIKFFDPDGRSVETDYYNQKGDKLGTDGIDNKKIVVVTDKTEVKLIKKTDKAGGTTAEKDVKSGVTLPGTYVRSEMKKAVDKAGSPSFHEEGGFFGPKTDGTGDYVIHAESGKNADPSKGEDASINVFKAANPDELNGNTQVIEGTFHTHPDGVIIDGNTTHRFENPPSGAKGYGDIPNAIENTMKVRGNMYVLAQGDRTVYIYNAGGVVATFPFKQFFGIGK